MRTSRTWYGMRTLFLQGKTRVKRKKMKLSSIEKFDKDIKKSMNLNAKQAMKIVANLNLNFNDFFA